MTAHLFVVMGSGETTPTMVTPHQRIFDQLPDDPSTGVLDTPYGFQENAGEISARTQEYFATNVGTPVEVVSLRAVTDPQDPEVERAQAQLADADWVFLGPGSPSYLLEQLRPTRVPELLRGRLADPPGATVVSSAAAVTVGSHAVPVYEIYKAGHEPHWLEGLDLLSVLGLQAVLIPHFDNAEGGTHDTRFCYLGERRLSQMEQQLPDDTWVLGVDEHTAMVVDLDEGTVEVTGRGGVTVRRRDGSTAVVPSGESTTIDELAATAARSGTTPAGTDTDTSIGTSEETDGTVPDADGVTGQGSAADATAAHEPLAAEVAALSDAFERAVGDADADAAADAVLDLERTVRAWQADTLTGDQMDRAVAALRGLITRLGEHARSGMTDPARVVGPYVELVLREREAAREAGEYDAADRLRDGLLQLGVELHDHPDGTTWELAEQP